MRALWLENQTLSLRDDVTTPVPPPGEALVRVLVAGICNTDIELTRGYYPFAGIPGHEFVGEWEGKRVVGEINAVCHACEACGEGRVTHCDNRTVLGIKSRNGAFAEYLALPMENLHRLPDEISTEEAVFVEPLAAALQIQEQVPITSDDRVLLVGEGKLGQLVARSLALTGCELLVIGKHPRKRSLLEAMGIKTADTVPATKFDVAIDCSGNANGFAIARQALRPRGTLVMKSTYAGEMTINASSLVVDEITVVGSRCGPFQKAIDLLASRKIDVQNLVEATYPIDQAITAFGHARRSGALKVLVKCSE
jgi:threonine dehydrogenase-like Zn-dependent dehydrogenase